MPLKKMGSHPYMTGLWFVFLTFLHSGEKGKSLWKLTYLLLCDMFDIGLLNQEPTKCQTYSHSSEETWHHPLCYFSPWGSQTFACLLLFFFFVFRQGLYVAMAVLELTM